MGQFWLHDIDLILRQGVGRGIEEVVEVHGWMTRSRGSGGFDSLNGDLKHHTASGPSWDWEKDIQYLAFTNPYTPSPISNLYHGREGRIAIIAAGASNHGGLGGAYKPGGPTYVDVNRANQTLIGNEMGNNGIGEQWPWKQIMASITADALICLAERWGSGRVFAHKEYCGPGTTQPGRKIDPFGPWENHPQRFWPDGSSWGPGQGDISAYRTLVDRKMVELSQEINIMNGFVLRPDNIPPRILDTRGPADNFDAYKVKAGTTFTVPVPGGAGKTCAIVNLASVHTEGQGFLTAWASGDKPNSSEMNPVPTSAVANEVTIPLAADGSFKLFSNVRTHIFIDLKGYYQPL
jgi:hypothetical protein